MSDDTRVRAFLDQMANEIDVTSFDRRAPVKRARRYRSVSVGLIAALVVALVSVGSIGLRSFTGSQPAKPPSEGPIVPNERHLFPRTATIGGLTLTSPSTWPLVNYWGNWDPDATSLTDHAEPLLELTSFDPGLTAPVCDGGSARMPAGGVAIFVLVGNDGRSAADLCGGHVDASSTGTIGSERGGSVPYTRVLSLGPNISDTDRATAERIWASMSWAPSLTFYGRGFAPRYVLDGWTQGAETSLFEAAPTAKSVDLTVTTTDANGTGYNDLLVAGVPEPNAIQGDTFGAVTKEAAFVKYERAGLAAPLLARIIDLPPSIHARFDAYVFEPQPTGGPFEVTAIGPDGSVLGSNLPPIAHTERIGTVQAFGATWSVDLSTTADGFWASTCVQPEGAGPPQPCDRGPGGGLNVQSFNGPQTAVFVTQAVGDNVGPVDVHAADGTVYHAVMLPIRQHGSVVGHLAVVALEGSGPGRFVYQLSGGGTDEGHRPEAQITWADLGQVIGNGSFPPPSNEA